MGDFDISTALLNQLRLRPDLFFMVMDRIRIVKQREQREKSREV